MALFLVVTEFSFGCPYSEFSSTSLIFLFDGCKREKDTGGIGQVAMLNPDAYGQEQSSL